MERIAMSQGERDDLHWLKRVEAGSMTQREAAEKMGVTARWVRKLVKRMKKQGDAVVVHGLRGRASNRKLSDKTQRQALTILKKPDWHDFGPTFAAEQLAKRHQIHVGKETLRGWMIEAGLWKSKVQTIEDVHVWRPRRTGFGELVQWDTFSGK
jgi:transposase